MDCTVQMRVRVRDGMQQSNRSVFGHAKKKAKNYDPEDDEKLFETEVGARISAAPKTETKQKKNEK